MNNLSDFQKVLLSVFKQFAQFCEKNDITYYAAYGTLIGAVRHHGLIPWDDDIDVHMTRANYDKFISLRETLKDTPYRISTVLDGESPYPFAKFHTTEGSVWEYKQFPYIIGPWIDVFPLDEDSKDEKSKAALENLHYSMWKYRKSLASTSWREILSDFRDLDLVMGGVDLVKKIRYAPFKKHYLHQIRKNIEVVKQIKGDTYRCYSHAIQNAIYEKSWFESATQVPFENTTIPIPNGYDAYLTFIYGDYMQVPPVEKRQTHPCFYIDLKHTKSREEILEELKGQTVEQKRMSLKVIIDEIKHRKKVF